MRSRYDDMSMACALKPFFAEALIRDYNPDNIIYLDADILVFNHFDTVKTIFNNQQVSIILTAHQYDIVRNDNEIIFNQNIRKYGR